MNREIVGTITVWGEDRLMFEKFAQDLNILWEELAVNIDGSIRYEIKASLVMDIFTLGEQLGIQHLSRAWRKELSE